jgi:hypothetical protein
MLLKQEKKWSLEERTSFPNATKREKNYVAVNTKSERSQGTFRTPLRERKATLQREKNVPPLQQSKKILHVTIIGRSIGLFVVGSKTVGHFFFDAHRRNCLYYYVLRTMLAYDHAV